LPDSRQHCRLQGGVVIDVNRSDKEIGDMRRRHEKAT